MAASAQNIELKARVASLATVRSLAESMATDRLGIEHQTDTYFHAPAGRLKLREIAGREAVLIAYRRENSTLPRPSDYLLVPVANPSLLCQALASTLGIRIIVRKQREIILYHQVRIHLDDVAGLGSFIEFEAVVGSEPDADAASGHARLQILQAKLGIATEDLVARSYSDLLSAE